MLAAVRPATAEVVQRPPPPFHLCRSITGQLPVYSKVSAGRTLKTTVLRKYTGDVEALRHALRQMLLERFGRELDVAMFHGRMEVKGHHVKLIKKWLLDLGF